MKELLEIVFLIVGIYAAVLYIAEYHRPYNFVKPSKYSRYELTLDEKYSRTPEEIAERNKRREEKLKRIAEREAQKNNGIETENEN